MIIIKSFEREPIQLSWRLTILSRKLQQSILPTIKISSGANIGKLFLIIGCC